MGKIWRENSRMFQTLDVGCGYLPDHKRRYGIGIDLQHGTCDVIGDVQCLPFKDEIFSFVYARNILEHLDEPIKTLKELRRVMQPNAKISITIPVYHNHCVEEMLKLVFGFPFRLIRTVKRLLRWRKHRFDNGFWHKNRIEVKHITRFFLVKRFEPIYENISLIKIPYQFASIHYILGEKTL